MAEKREFGVDRILTKSAVQHRRVQEVLQDLGGRPLSEKLRSYEFTPSERDCKIISHAEEVVNEMIRSYGVEPKAFPQKKIFLLRAGAFKAVGHPDFTAWVYPLKQEIAIERTESDVELAKTVAHEYWHLQSYRSVKFDEERGKLVRYRGGVMIRTEEVDYFGQLDEAIIARLMKVFYERVRSHALYRGEAESTEELKRYIGAHPGVLSRLRKIPYPGQKGFVLEDVYAVASAGRVLKELQGSDEESGSLEGLLLSAFARERTSLAEYPEERQRLEDLLDEIVEKSDGIWGDQESIFTEFVRAELTGNLLPIARMMERTLGKGSFRRIAEEFEEIRHTA